VSEQEPIKKAANHRMERRSMQSGRDRFKWSAASPVFPIVTPAKTAESYIQDVVQQIAKKWKLKFENSAPSPRPSHRCVTTKLPTQFHTPLGYLLKIQHLPVFERVLST
jgi:hypothetical protein